MIRVLLPAHLRSLARVDGEVCVDVNGQPTLGGVLDALEVSYPVLRGTMRDHVTHDPPETRLPDAVVAGTEPFLVVGAMAGG
jgi:sulfur-carrier protein